MIKYITKEQAQYKANLHCHSVISDGHLTPEELKKIYKEHGYSILSITDHEVPVDHSDLTDDDFIMLTGYEAYIRPGKPTYEYYKPEVHINLFAKEPHNVSYVNFNEGYCKYVKDPAVREGFNKVGSQKPREYTVEYINEFVQTARDNGYLCAHNHAVWSLEDQAQIAGYRGFFSMEICNYGSYLDGRMEYNAALYERLLRDGQKIYVHSADDNHNGEPIDSPESDSFGGFAMVLAKELSYSSVIEALEQGDFYSSMGPMIKELTFDGTHVHIETDPVRQITMRLGGKKALRVIGDAAHPVTSADFEIPAHAPFVRFSLYDFEGRYADTRGFFREELGL